MLLLLLLPARSNCRNFDTVPVVIDASVGRTLADGVNCPFVRLSSTVDAVSCRVVLSCLAMA